MKRLILLFACIVMFTMNALAQFSGSGSGTKDDPYRIFNADQLNQLRNFLNRGNVYFSLEADIDLKDWIEDNNPVQGWQPIGDEKNSFQGILNGNNHTISHLKINRPQTDYTGFFGHLFGAIISNLSFENVTIAGKDKVGFCGRMERSTINKISLKDASYIGASCVGGIVGHSLVGELKICNCTFVGNITAEGDGIGGIVGSYNNYGSFDSPMEVDSCSFYGKIIGHDNIGGIIGNISFISPSHDSHCEACVASVEIIGNDHLGGIAGYSPQLSIQHCFSETKINGKDNIGGLVGSGGSNIQSSYAFSKLRGDNYIGGLIGSGKDYGNLQIADSYSTGIVRGKQYVGGIVSLGGKVFQYGYPVSIIRSYSDCVKISGESNVAGLAWSTDHNAIAYNCVALNAELRSTSDLFRLGNVEGSNNYAWVKTKMVLNNEVLPIPDDSNESGTSIGLSALKLRATYQGLGWDFANTWNIQETECFPYLLTQTAPPYFVQKLKKGDTHLAGTCTEDGTVTVRVNGKTYTTVSNNHNWSINVDPLQVGDEVRIFVTAEGKQPSYILSPQIPFVGEGTEANPYLITSADELHNATDDACYKLVNDIDLGEWIAQNNEGKGWIPVGSMAKIDGDGHTISGLICDNTYENAGLFSHLGTAGEIKNLKVIMSVGQFLSGKNAVGVVVGVNDGTISNVVATGSINKGVYMGGIAGKNSGKIINAWANTKIRDGLNAGGITGENSGYISQSFSEGSLSTISKEGKVGGIAGNSTGNVADCYSTVTVTALGANTYAAGLVGYNEGTVNHSYAAGDVKGYVAAGIVGYNSGEKATLKECVAINNIVRAVKTGLRVLGGCANGAKLPEMTDNYALKTMVVSVNDVPKKVYDDPFEGTAKTEDVLMSMALYESAGWNFKDVWKIDEGTSYPYQETFNVPVTALTLDKAEANVNVDETLKLTATVSPGNARNKTLTWSSSNEDVAKVSNDGLVTALKSGETQITVKSNDGTNISSVCIVTVENLSSVARVETGKPIVTVHDRIINVTGLAENAVVTIHIADGKTVYVGTAHAVKVSTPGLYIVTVGEKMYKVPVK